MPVTIKVTHFKWTGKYYGGKTSELKPEHLIDEKLFTQMLIADKFHIYMDRSESIIGRKRVTWDPKVSAHHNKLAEDAAKCHFSP